jgi:hypothetical protein
MGEEFEAQHVVGAGTKGENVFSTFRRVPPLSIEFAFKRPGPSPIVIAALFVETAKVKVVAINIALRAALLNILEFHFWLYFLGTLKYARIVPVRLID